VANVINVVDTAFRTWEAGRGKIPAKTYLFPEHGHFRGVPATPPVCADGKTVNVPPEKPFHGSPLMQEVLETYESGSQD
jgi:hypothetical protein